MYAKAIYENIAESPDELAFKRGDILTIIEQDTDGIEGWWLCTLRGRQVINTHFPSFTMLFVCVCVCLYCKIQPFFVLQRNGTFKNWIQEFRRK